MATARIYPAAYLHLGLARVQLLTADLKVTLLDSSYTPGDDHTWAADLTGEVAGGSYPFGGVPVTGRDYALAGDTGTAVLTCDPVAVDDPAFTYRYAVLYADTGDPAASPLLASFDTGADTDATLSPPLTLTFTAGLIRLGPIAPEGTTP